MGLFDRFKGKPEDPSVRFWSWFQKNKDRVRVMLTDHDRGMRAYKELTTEIQRVHEDIVPELTQDDNGDAVLVISADGIREAVEVVIRLADAAPVLEGWRVERFRKPAPEGMRIAYEGLDIDPAIVRVAYQVDDVKQVVHIGLIIPGYEEKDIRFKGVGFLYLDHSIGEYNTIMHIGQITFMPHEQAPPNAELLTLSQLRELIEERFY